MNEIISFSSSVSIDTSNPQKILRRREDNTEKRDLAGIYSSIANF
jgi:hypothetical protein